MKWNRQGIDISEFQGSVDWNKIKGTCKFVFVKATQGSSWVDPLFTKDRVRMILGSHIAFGPYHFADNSSIDGKTEARHFFNTAVDAGWDPRRDLPGVLDIETGVGGRVGVRFVRRFVKEYRNLVKEKFGLIRHRPIIYTGNFWREALGNPIILTRCPLWLAAYTSGWRGFLPRAWKKPHIWQYTDSFHCPGVNSPCDGDRYLRSLRSFGRL